MKRDVYVEPFLSSWPTPLSLKDIKECFVSKKTRKKERHNKIVGGRTNVINTINAFLKVLTANPTFNA